MPKIPTFQSQTRPTGVINTRRLSTADFGGDLGLGKLGDVIQKREEEEDRAKAHDTLTKLRTNFTQAFLDQSSRQDLELNKFTESFDEYMVKQTESVQDQFNTHAGRSMFDENFKSMRQSFLQKSIQFQVEATRQNAINQFSDGLNTSRNVLVSDPTQVNEVLDAQSSYIDSMSIPPDAKTKLRESTARGLALSAVQGTMMIDPSMAEEDLKAGRWDTYLDADDKARMLASIASTRSKSKAEARAALSNVKPRMMEGLAIPGAETGEINMLIQNTGDPNLQREWMALQAIQQQNQQLRTLRPQDAQGYINSVLAPKVNDTATQAEFEQLEAASKLLGTMRSEIERDALSWASRAGVIELAPLGVDGSYESRALAAKQVADYYGVKVSPFTADEAAEITQRLDSATPTQQLVELRRMSEGLGDLSFDAFSQLGNENGLYAHAGALLSISDNHVGVVQSMLEGAKLLKEDKKAAAMLGGETGAPFEFTRQAGNAFQHIPKARSAVRTAANALYARMATQEGQFEFDPSLYDRALRMAVGGSGEPGTGFAEINDVQFVLPPNTTDTQFERAIERMTNQVLVNVSEGGAPPKFADGTLATPEQIADEGRFQYIGHNRYAITMQDGGYLLGSGPNGYYVMNLGAKDITDINKFTKQELQKMGFNSIPDEAP